VAILSHVLAAVAVMACAVIYGTDVFRALMQRPALAHVDDRALTSVMGHVHQYGDRRLPVPGALGIAATILAAITAGIAGRPAAAAAVLAAWLIIYLRVSLRRALAFRPAAGRRIAVLCASSAAKGQAAPPGCERPVPARAGLAGSAV
jgi:hypothetical protein